MRRQFTATAFVIDSKHRTLLMWHKRLQRWMPPGGHVDPDELPEETAARECKEETGLTVEILGDPQEDVFAGNPEEGRMLKKPVRMLLEEIPASPERGEAAHQHMDFIYLARPIDEAEALIHAPAEADQVRWFTRREIEETPESQIFHNVRSYLLSILPA